jgi:hypothetical protein
MQRSFAMKQAPISDIHPFYSLKLEQPPTVSEISFTQYCGFFFDLEDPLEIPPLSF